MKTWKLRLSHSALPFVPILPYCWRNVKGNGTNLYQKRYNSGEHFGVKKHPILAPFLCCDSFVYFCV